MSRSARARAKSSTIKLSPANKSSFLAQICFLSSHIWGQLCSVKVRFPKKPEKLCFVVKCWLLPWLIFFSMIAHPERFSPRMHVRTMLCSKMQRSPAPQVLQVDVHAAFEEKLHHEAISISRCEVQRTPSAWKQEPCQTNIEKFGMSTCEFCMGCFLDVFFRGTFCQKKEPIISWPCMQGKFLQWWFLCCKFTKP